MREGLAAGAARGIAVLSYAPTSVLQEERLDHTLALIATICSTGKNQFIELLQLLAAEHGRSPIQIFHAPLHLWTISVGLSRKSLPFLVFTGPCVSGRGNASVKQFVLVTSLDFSNLRCKGLGPEKLGV